jgi:hypothetical protein
MRIKKLAAVAAMAVTMMGIGTGAQALLIDAEPETDFTGAVLAGIGDFLDEETDELVNDDSNLLAQAVDGLLNDDDALLLEDVEDVLCIVLEGDVSPDCEDAGPGSDLLDGILGGVLPDVLLGEDGILAVVGVGAFVGLF